MVFLDLLRPAELNLDKYRSGLFLLYNTTENLGFPEKLKYEDSHFFFAPNSHIINKGGIMAKLLYR